MLTNPLHILLHNDIWAKCWHSYIYNIILHFTILSLWAWEYIRFPEKYIIYVGWSPSDNDDERWTIPSTTHIYQDIVGVESFNIC